jgi:hypothetical protein
MNKNDMAQALAQVTAERDQLKAKLDRLLKEDSYLTCVYCGHEFDPTGPAHGADVLKEHIVHCSKHPMAEVVKQRDKLVKVAVVTAGLIGIFPGPLTEAQQEWFNNFADGIKNALQ